MDIQNLLCHTTTTKSPDYVQYEKQPFEYYPSSPSGWSSISSKTYMSEPITGSILPTRTNSSELSDIVTMNYSLPSSGASTPTMNSASSPTINMRSSSRKHQTRTPWTTSEDYLLEKGYMQGLSWALISAKYLPHRSRGCCWGRFKTLQTKSTERRSWSESDDRILLGAIKKHTKLFKHAWKSVAMDLNNRDWRECEIRSARISVMLPPKNQHLQ